MFERWLSLMFLGLLACGEVLPPPDTDPCTDVCECKVDTDCGAHEVCDDQVTSRTCTCAAGYTENLSGACAWSGVVADPGFQSPTAWKADATAAVDVNLNAAGMIEPGAARFQQTGLCGLARITQSLQMPRRSRAEPLVAQISYRYIVGNFLPIPIPPAFGIGPVWQDNLALPSTQFKTTRVCLGTDQYAPESSQGRGGERALAIMPARLPFQQDCTDPNVSLDVDRFEIVPAGPGECPEPDTAINGNVEADGGWLLTNSSANGNPSSAAIEAGVGEASTRGVRMFARNRCSDTSATTRVSVSSRLASPALSFYNKTSAVLTGVSTFSALSSIALPQITASGAPITQKVCVPAALRGAVFDFRAGMSLSGTCADIVNAESIIDSVQLLDEPSCGTDSAITDPGFEAAFPLIGSSFETGKSFVRALSDPTSAHSGSGVLQLSVMQLCSQAQWQANVIVPPSQGAAGPALRFFYRAKPLTNSTFSVSSGGPAFTPTLNDQWNEGKVCLNPRLAGRNQQVSFGLFTSGTCANTFPTEVAFIDDLQVITDPACAPM
jgi:hypothetical protein